MEKPVENYTDVEIMGRKFRIRKFDARTGSFMLFKVVGLLAPLFRNVDFEKLKRAKDFSEVDIKTLNVPGLMQELGNLSESDFAYVQEKCLQVCSEYLPSGFTPVLNENGSFGVIGLEEDTITVLALTAHALIFNVKGFFSESPLASIVGGFTNTFLRDS